MLIKEIRALIHKEILFEWRMKYAFSGILLYLTSSVFVVYIVFELGKASITPTTWNVLLWVVMLFVATNATAKSFIQESRERLLYYYTIASPESVMISKILFNGILMTFLVIGGCAIFMILLGNPVQDMTLFIFNLIIGAIGFAASFTMISGIASKATNSSTLMAILGFPVILPMLLLLIKVSGAAIDGLDRSVSYDELMTLMAIIIISITTSVILFPYLWRSN